MKSRDIHRGDGGVLWDDPTVGPPLRFGEGKSKGEEPEPGYLRFRETVVIYLVRDPPSKERQMSRSYTHKSVVVRLSKLCWNKDR